jgi:hypothetical protein
VRLLSALAVVLLVAFVIRELTATVPAVHIELFKDSIFASGTLIGAVMFAILMSLTFLLPVFMQEVLGFTAVQSGLALMPRSLVMTVAMPIVGRLYNKVSPRLTVAFGVVPFSISAYMMSHYTLSTSSSDIVAVLVIQGVAFACLFIPLTTVALAKVPRNRLADATGLNSLIRQIGGSLGLAARDEPRRDPHARHAEPGPRHDLGAPRGGADPRGDRGAAGVGAHVRQALPALGDRVLGRAPAAVFPTVAGPRRRSFFGEARRGPHRSVNESAEAPSRSVYTRCARWCPS